MRFVDTNVLLYSVSKDHPLVRLVPAVLVTGAWLILLGGLMIAPVWEEVTLVEGGLSSDRLSDSLQSIWRQGSTYRPLAQILAFSTVRLIGDFELAWQLQRWLNAAAVVLSVWLLLAFIEHLAPAHWASKTIFLAMLLFSASAFITGSWWANLYDAYALLFLSGGLLVLVRGYSLAAGGVMGLAFFCKEAAILIFPFLVLLYLRYPALRRSIAKSVVVTLGCMAIYWVARSDVVILGSPGDIHRLNFGAYWPTLSALVGSFWWQDLEAAQPGLGLVFALLGLLLLRSYQSVLAMSLLLATAALIYLGMLEIGPLPLLTGANFAGRLYLIPAVLWLVALNLQDKRGVLVVLMIPLLWGAQYSYRRHAHFQNAYAAVYRTAAASTDRPLQVFIDQDSTIQTLHSKTKGLSIGVYPQSKWELGARVQTRRVRSGTGLCGH